MNVIKLTLRTLIMAGLLAFAAAPSYAQNCGAPTTDGLLAYWTLDEPSGAFADASGNGYDGTQSGGVSRSQPGVIGDAVGFDGVDDYIDLNGTLGSQTLLDFTFSAWYKSSQLSPTDDQYIIVFGDPIGSEDYILFSVGDDPGYEGHVRAYVRAQADATGDFYSTVSVMDQQWHHIALVRAGGQNYYIYIDGILAGSNNNLSMVGKAVDPTNNNHVFMGDDPGATEQVNGFLDDVRIYSRALTAQEIGQLQSYGQGKEGVLTFSEQDKTMYYCDGTDWVAMGGSGYVPNAVTFDGVNDQLLENSYGGSDLRYVTGSFWIRRDTNNLGTSQTIVHSHDTGSGYFRLRFNTSNELVIDGRETGLGPYNLLVNSTTITDDNWHHVFFSIDSTNRSLDQIYIDEVDETASLSATYSAFGAGQIVSIGAFNSGNEKIYGDLADLWVDFDNYIDWSVEANRRAFIDARGLPVDLGADGSGPTGTSPDVFLSGDTANWHTNKGTAPGFTENGALTQASFAANNSGNPNLSSGLIAHWKFDESSGTTAADSSGTGNDAPLDNGTPVWEQGKYGNATSGGEFGVTSMTSFPTTAVTVSGWVKIDADSNWNDVVNYAWGGGTGGYAMHSDSTGTVLFGVMDGGLQRLVAKNNATSIGEWAHWTGTYDGTDIKLYINSELVDTVNRPGITLQNTGSFYIADANGNITVDDLRIYNRALTAAEVKALNDLCGTANQGKIQYNAALSVMQYCDGYNWVAMGPIGGDNVTSGLVGHWTFDETSGTFADASGNGNTGTASGGVSYNNNGVVGKAVSLNGTDGYIDVGENSVLEPPLPVSVTAWIKMNSITGSNQIFRTNQEASVYNGYWVQLEPGSGLLSATYGDAAGIGSTHRRTKVALTNPIQVGEWTHVAYVIRGATDMDLYVNGVDVGGVYSGTGGSMAYDGTSGRPAVIGFRDTGTPEYFDGAIDDLRVYNRSLTATEINQLYQWSQTQVGDVDNGCANAGSITGATAEGIMLYNTDNNVLQYCNGEYWVGVGK